TFEYAIKKDVRNNPIVREVDERRLREQWHTLFIVVLFVAVVLFSGWQRVELLQHGYRLEQMQQQRGLPPGAMGAPNEDRSGTYL
ncbi:MAG: hypothetical protein QOD30_1767, partial [Actinomycetota bacterium]|nr:hypothetical protein [Actinomycetota bacterium]